MGKLLDLGDVPGLRDPFLVIHLHGWTDAGMAGQTAAVFLRSRWNATPLATFDADELSTTGPGGRWSGWPAAPSRR